MDVREILENLVKNTNEALGKTEGLSVTNVKSINEADRSILDFWEKECFVSGFDIYQIIDKIVCFVLVSCGVLCVIAITTMLLRIAFR